jgi:hypothetical protein
MPVKIGDEDVVEGASVFVARLTSHRAAGHSVLVGARCEQKRPARRAGSANWDF